MVADLRLGLMLGYWGANPDDATETVLAAEACGFDSVWTAEAYGSDAFTPLTWYAARTSRSKLGTGLVQLSGRTPAATAMTAATLDALSGGRLTLGLGVSGPQVVEGWYGVPFPKPLERTRDYVEIVRKLWRREVSSSDSVHYPLPYPGGTGLGKSIKLTLHPVRDRIPILIGAEGPKNVEMATQIAEGWLPIFYHVERASDYYAEALSGAPEGFQVCCPVTVSVNDDVATALEFVKWSLAFYIGGMGAASMNFHLNVLARLGNAAAAAEAQQLDLSGDREAAMKPEPDALADGTALCGPLDRIRERLELWRKTPVTTILAGGVRNPDHLKALADMIG
jgi:F420-dependent oxidoreductase-like protein